MQGVGNVHYITYERDSLDIVNNKQRQVVSIFEDDKPRKDIELVTIECIRMRRATHLLREKDAIWSSQYNAVR